MVKQTVEQDAQHQNAALVDCGNCNRRVIPTNQSVVRASARQNVPGLFGRMRMIFGCPECQAQFA